MDGMRAAEELALPVPAGCDGWLLRDFLAKAGVSSGLVRLVKRSGGFFAGGRPGRTRAPVAARPTPRPAPPPPPPPPPRNCGGTVR